MPRPVLQFGVAAHLTTATTIRTFLLVSAIACALVQSCFRAHAQAAPTEEIATLEREAEADLRAQKPELAIAAYKKILKLDPGNPGAHSNLGLAYYVHGDFAPAAGEFNIALGKMADQWNIVALCGISEANVGRNSDAIAHLDQAFQHVQDSDLRITAGKRLFGLLFEKGDLDHAAEIVGRLRQFDPNNIDVIYAAHQVYSLLESRSFLTMAQLAPDSARLYQLRGDRMAQIGNTRAAISAYLRAIERDAHLSGVHFELGEILSVSRDAAERGQAENEYQKALADNPQDEKAECRLGDIAMQRSDLPGAAGHYQRALKLQPDDPDANEGYGMELLASDSPLEARTYLKRAIQLDPTSVAAWYHLSQASRRAGNVEEATREMNEFLRLKTQRENLKRSFEDLPLQAVRESTGEDTQAPPATAPK